MRTKEKDRGKRHSPSHHKQNYLVILSTNRDSVQKVLVNAREKKQALFF